MTGSENLTIEGEVDGSIVLKGQTLTLGADARVKATVEADRVVVSGEVIGDIAAERIDITSTGSVSGDLCAPRLTMSDGARLQGHVDTGQDEAAPAQRDHRRASA